MLFEGVGVTLDRLSLPAKRSGLLSSGAVFPHGNTATRSLNKLTKFGRKVLEHQPYCPNLSPCDIHIFGSLKKILKGRHFYSDIQVIDTIRNWFQSQPNKFYEQGIHHLDKPVEQGLV
ncbi:hypothetical protein AVEN_74545-1 [Araneus ventricosus]|uniref:Histone-lysine N-methyltransferase SETMAR n=1 Tax=Araneus ventricosus TaxID=182803 RepID=A0A4Y2GRP5_ARAVE|nr:hypothetical protein AVEN_74545-1 [Araneus ventricosus]